MRLDQTAVKSGSNPEPAGRRATPDIEINHEPHASARGAGARLRPVYLARVRSGRCSSRRPGTIILPYGEWIVAAANTAAAVLIPALAAFLIKAVTSVYPWAGLLLTQRRVEQMVNAVTEYAINAVPKAVKEGKLPVNVGMQVIAEGVQYAIDWAPGRVMAAAGGKEGLARIIFRKLNLEDGANEANTLAPAITALGGK